MEVTKSPIIPGSLAGQAAQKPYSSPKLVEYGKIEDLTQVGGKPGADFAGGTTAET